MTNLSPHQLRQIAEICAALNKVEDGDLYKDMRTDATLINTEISVTTRADGQKLGVIKMGNNSSYVFVSA